MKLNNILFNKFINKLYFDKNVYDTSKDADEIKFLGKKPALLDFHAKWCGPCKVLGPVLEELGIDDKSILKNIFDVSQYAEKEDVRLRALFKLSDILDLEDKNSTKVTQITGALFQGFSNKELENVERPKEIGG